MSTPPKKQDDTTPSKQESDSSGFDWNFGSNQSSPFGKGSTPSSPWTEFSAMSISDTQPSFTLAGPRVLDPEAEKRKLKTTFKCVVVGDAEIGKTAWVNRLAAGLEACDEKLASDALNTYTPTAGANVKTVTFKSNKGPFTFEMWDVAGDASHRGLRSSSYVLADCAILGFSVTKYGSYRNVPNWYREISDICGDIPMGLVGFQADATGPTEVSLSSVTFHRKKNLDFSLLYRTGQNVSKPLLSLVRRIKDDNGIVFEEDPFASVVSTPTKEQLSSSQPTTPNQSTFSPLFQFSPKTTSTASPQPLSPFKFDRSAPAPVSSFSFEDPDDYDEEEDEDYDEEYEEYDSDAEEEEEEEEEEEPAKPAKKRAGLAPPKQPMSAYLMWSEQTRPKLKEENPSMNFVELVKKLAEQWKEMPESEKQVWNDRVEVAKKKYQEELAAYKAALNKK